ncbi:MAG TPA: UDP-N-acetylmuramoyl-tripeptide--D-alanyl-D-alanine ligase [Bacillota bacterium]|nr:UDP-N-acetylmuramoyl-tripeptide--D-alanyl-D-alanine ligase [Bacillota bacterium]
MLFLVDELYETSQIHGSRHASFLEVAVTGPDGGPDAAFVLLTDTYLCHSERLQKALELGSRVCIGTQLPKQCGQYPTCTFIRVDDPLTELIRLTSLLRKESTATFIGITGSSGKTTTKDMIAHLLRGRNKKTLKTFHNYNGLLGIPLTLRKLRSDDRFAVLEIGLGDPGSVDRGAELVQPHVAVITNIGESHVGRFKTLSEIAREKSAILRHLQPGGLAVLNGDDPYCRAMQEYHSGRVLLFGRGADCEVRILSINQVAYNQLDIRLAFTGGTLSFSLSAVGEFQAYNAAASASVALHLGLGPEEICHRFASFKTGEQRMKTYVKDQLLVVDDGYNASPQGMRMAVAAFDEIPWPGARVLIIGDPQDQGDLSKHYLSDTASLVAASKSDLVIWFGAKVAALIAEVPGSRHAETVEQAADLARKATCQGGAIFIKGTDDKLLKALRLRLLL